MPGAESRPAPRAVACPHADGGAPRALCRPRHPAGHLRPPDFTLPAAPPVTATTVLTWRQATTAHFTYYYLPGSLAAHDLPQIMATGEQAIRDVAAALALSPTARLQVYFVNRIFWQGGASYADNVLLISYVDPARDYVASDLGTVLRHEATHALVAQRVGDDKKGGMLGEGVAVWAAGGHYHPEPLTELAAHWSGRTLISTSP